MCWPLPYISNNSLHTKIFRLTAISPAVSCHKQITIQDGYFVCRSRCCWCPGKISFISQLLWVWLSAAHRCILLKRFALRRLTGATLLEMLVRLWSPSREGHSQWLTDMEYKTTSYLASRWDKHGVPWSIAPYGTRLRLGFSGISIFEELFPLLHPACLIPFQVLPEALSPQIPYRSILFLNFAS